MNSLWMWARQSQFLPLPFSCRFVSRLGRYAMVGVLWSVLCSGVYAQPAKRQATPAPTAAQQRRAFLTRFKEEVRTNAEQATAKAAQFLTDHPDWSAWDRIQFLGDVAQALYFNGAPADRVTNARTAVALLQGGMEQYPMNDRRLYLVERLVAIQRAQRDFTGAQMTLETNWPVALRVREGHWSHELLEEYRHLLRAQKRPQEVVDVTRELIEARPEEALHRWTRVAARTQRDWYGKGDVNRMVDALLEVGNRAEALRWAKLGWQMSEFSKQGIAEASAALAKGWSGPGLDLSQVRAFALAQRDADAPNPLREVELPTWDKTVLRRTIKNMGDESAKVTLLIADQRLGEALAVAQRMIESDPLGVRGAAGVRGVAQVFKAHDLNTVRANAFVQWIAKPNGEVENPLPALERELAAEAKPAN